MYQARLAQRSAAISIGRSSLKRYLRSCGIAFHHSQNVCLTPAFCSANGSKSRPYLDCRMFSSASPMGVVPEEEDDDENDEKTFEEVQGRVAKDQRAARRRAAQLVPYWLKSEPYCFERTVQALNLHNMANDQRFQTGNSFTAKSDLPGQYRKAFKDSIVSFTERILETGKNVPTPVEAALGKLADAGFSDVDFARDFQNLKKDQIQVARLTARIQKQEEKLTKRRETMNVLEGKVTELETELEKLVTEKEAFEESIRKAEDSDGARTANSGNPINSLKSMFGTALTGNGKEKMREQEEILNAENERKEQILLEFEQSIKKLENQVAGRRNHLEQHEKASENAQETVKELKRQQAKAQGCITAEVYEEVQKVVKEAMLVICDSLADHIQERHSHLIETYQNIDAKTDLTKPNEWYSYARLDHRKIIYHGGPTNSGKTYNALQRLKQAKRGIYLGPLRLLAAEVYEKLNAEGVYTSLVTGQERREFPFSTHIAATVEMAANLIEEEFDVVVIDEIQMIEDKERGFAWTRALLGLRCKEIHLCGGLEARKIVERIVKACGDEFELHQYDRFSSLEIESRSLSSKPAQLGAYAAVQPGDCIVAFSRTDIFAIKREIEATTNHKCCVVYGTLPPDIRTSQARLFNDPNSGYDILVASDAISMGLNLNIRRVIFNSIYKNDGSGIVRLGHSAVKQIAGRAGRRNSPFPNGEVTCRDPRDLKYIRECLGTDIEPINKAGLIPTGAHIEQFGKALQQYHYGTTENEEGEEITPHLHTILKEFSDMAVVKGDFFLCRQDHMHTIAKWLKDIPLETNIKFDFCMAPINLGNPVTKAVLVKYGQKLGAGEVPGMTRGSPLKRAVSFDDMAVLCAMYADVELFIWLQNKFPPINLMEQQAALSRKDSAASFITLGLQEAERLKLNHCYVKRDVSLRRQIQGPEVDDSDNDDDLNESEDWEDGFGESRGRQRGVRKRRYRR